MQILCSFCRYYPNQCLAASHASSGATLHAIVTPVMPRTRANQSTPSTITVTRHAAIAKPPKDIPRAAAYTALRSLAASKVGKGAVGLGHFVGVFLLLEGDAGLVARINDLCCQALAIRHATLGSGSLH